MNKSALKKYAPQARLDFIAAVTRRAELLGLNPQSPSKVEQQGEALLINGHAFPAAYGRMRTTLETRIREQGFAQVMEAMAYTWFNRLVAIRYMELHGFLDHGYRVLSHPANKETGHTQPEILDHIADLELPGLDKSVALELKLAGNKDEELYREVLLAQCHALHQAMPFLFESLDDATELLLPDGLLRTDSILGKLVTAIDEADWQDVEIIGWLYQFYISEKKDQVIGKVVKSEDIPAATQLFTPNWIVKYLVQNSLGRLWLMANPTSTLASKWEYYIKPAEQTPEVNAQLDALIQTRIDEDGATLNPESLTLLDPACGSGHILVEAYDLLRDIYLERGYRRQDIPRLILEKNLFGLDIDDRAAQLAGFALLMKARADDRRLFVQPVNLNVLALQEAKEGSAAALHSALNAPQIDSAVVNQLVETFEQAKTFGSLIQIPRDLASALSDVRRELEAVRQGGDMLGRDAAETLLGLVEQAEVLAKQFDAVVANPPYLAAKAMSKVLKAYAKGVYPANKADMFAMFAERIGKMARQTGYVGLMTPFTWMFLKSYDDLRASFFDEFTIGTLVQPEYHAFFDSAYVPVCAFTLQAQLVKKYRATFIRLEEFYGAELQSEKTLEAIKSENCDWRYEVNLEEFEWLPGRKLAYWITPKLRRLFLDNSSFSDICEAQKGLAPCDSDQFVRFWWEVDRLKIGLEVKSCEDSVNSQCRWFPFNKGGSFRRWFGNVQHVVDWESDGRRVKAYIDDRYPYLNGNLSFVTQNTANYFRPAIVWTMISSGDRAFRISTGGEISSNALQSAYFSKDVEKKALAYLNTPIIRDLMRALSPTLNSNLGEFLSLPVPCELEKLDVDIIVDGLVELYRTDWNSFETSLNFEVPYKFSDWPSLEELFFSWDKDASDNVGSALESESAINQKCIELVGLGDEYDFRSQEATCVLLRPTREYVAKFCTSISVGCMMGRYSLDAPGLIYAHAGNESFDPSRYETFPADDDGIVPITDEAWFDDDGANRIREFVRVVWGEETEAENMAWLAESIGSKASESADDTIRRYLSRDFYKDHLQTYKKRPIYWLFSSGKNKAFEALVYLHRYNAGTLSRMRMEYVVPLQSRMQARIDNLDQDIQSSTSSAEQKRFQKQKDKLIKQLDELRRFDENLRHYADQRIPLDLDDGVKVNYGKFGDLLAEVKAVTGKK